jgi:hypothetical protein
MQRTLAEGEQEVGFAKRYTTVEKLEDECRSDNSPFC